MGDVFRLCQMQRKAILFFPPVVLDLEDLTLETRDPEAWGPETRNPGIPCLVTQDLKAVLAKEEVSMF